MEIGLFPTESGAAEGRHEMERKRGEIKSRKKAARIEHYLSIGPSKPEKLDRIPYFFADPGFAANMRL